MRKSILFFSILFLWTCGGGGGDKTTGPQEPPIVINLTSLTGQAQKGPFNNGTAINVAELTNTLSPTGRNFSSAITDNTGRFSVANVQLESPYVELRANGYYFNEVSNNLSEGQLTLFALSNLTGKTSLNVNIITHLEKNRMITLMSGDNPQTFAQAKISAQESIFAIFDYSRANVPESELLDISQGGAANAKLLAISAIVQGDLTVAQMSELLANISTDIASDGTLDDASLRATLINNSKNLDMAAVRANLVSRYASLGISISISDFETEINQFLKPPVSQDINASTTEDTAINITLSAADPEGESLTYTILEVNNATITLNGNVANYTPDANFNGTDTFTYKANDGTSDSNIATVTMTVSSEDDEPNTNDVSTTTDEDEAVDVSLSADEYDGENYSFSIVSDPSNGAVSLSGTTATYTPNQDWNGTDTFTFEATDDRIMFGKRNVATATITVNAINDAPVANDITNQITDENRMMQLDITLDASDVDGDALAYSISSASNGTLSLNNDIVTYVPNQDWNGEDTFTYTANDGSLDSNTATVTITVNSIPDAPVILDSSFELDEDSTTADGVPVGHVYVTDVDETTDGSIFSGTVTLVSAPEYGSLSQIAGTVTLDVGSEVISGNSVKYHPNQNYHGTDSFTWKANDGTLDSNIATVMLTINPVNDAPITFPLSETIEMNEDTSSAHFFVNIIDPEGDLPVPEITNLPSGWTAGWNYYNFYVKNSNISNNNDYATISLQYSTNKPQVLLGFSYENSSWQHYSLSTDNDWPEDNSSPFTTREARDQILSNVLKFLDEYPWVDSLEDFKTIFDLITNKQFVNTSILFQPIQDYNGNITLNFQASENGQGAVVSNVSSINLQVNNVNDAPVANDITSSVDKNWTGHTIKIKGDSEGGSDIDGDDLSFIIVTPPSNGNIFNDSGGGVPQGNALANGDTLTSFYTIYNPNTDFVGTDTFTFRVSDGNSSNGGVFGEGGTVTMNVRGANVTMDEFVQVTPGYTHYITWDGYFENTGIDLYKNGTKIYNIVEDVGSANQYAWTVPTGKVAGNGFRIKVYDAGSGDDHDFSDYDLTITPEIMFELESSEYFDHAGPHLRTNDGNIVVAGGRNSNAYLLKIDASDGSVLWSNEYGNTGFNNIDSFNQVIESNNGGLIATGLYNYSSGNFGDAFWVKTDSNGNEEFSDSFGTETTEYEHAQSIINTDDGGYFISARFDNGSTYIKLDANHAYQWHKDYQTGNYHIPLGHIIKDSDGGIIILSSEASWGEPSDLNPFLRKVDSSNGDEIWRTATLGNGGAYSATHMSQTSDGGAIISGYERASPSDNSFLQAFVIKVDASGNQEWFRGFQDLLSNGRNLVNLIESVSETPSDGGYIAVGSRVLRFDNNDNDIRSVYVLKMDSNGDKQWDCVLPLPQVNTSNERAGRGISEIQNGHYVITGSHSLFLKINANFID